MSRRQHTRGFTLIEIMVALMVMALIGAATVPVASRMKSRANVTRVLRDISANLKRARALAATGIMVPIGAPPVEFRSKYAALEVADSTNFIILADTNTDPEDDTELTIATYNLTIKDAGLRIISPDPGTRIMFRSTGSPVSGDGLAREIRIEDQVSGKIGVVSVSESGAIRITY